MVQNVANVMQDLDPEDFHLLSGVEHGMRFSEWVKRGKLTEFSGLAREEVDYRLNRCLDRELVERKTIQYEGIRLRFAGYDALALRTFAKRGTIEGFGAPLGVGKESDVFEVQSYRPMALKFHREGYTNFREVHKERDYASDSEHISWFYTARKAAEREYEVLETLYPDVSVPRPEDQNRHAIVMEMIAGAELARTKLTDQQVRPILAMILRELASAYQEGYVHADMSQYNVFVNEQGVTVFDWPQAVATDHENAEEFLARDVRNLFGYFERKYPGQIPEIDQSALVSAVREGSFDSIEEFEE
ncbi:serine/threonine-protein kinase RIO2 [Halalkalicoccus salilacus]|uniref:serine/threonine-protein kinase RIO2 n=1 Tax=Halalkalicoccus salilacus TaxID=3117459 RepID=UPI00300F4924